jgi:dehydrogenase/reductase SDR family member 4
MADRGIRQSFDLSGKVAIVSGSSRGIGESIAFGLAAFGAKVVVTSRSQERADKIANDLKNEGYDALAVGCHIGDEDQIKNLVEKTISHYGKIDILFNNAATNPLMGPLEDMGGDLFDKMMSINVKSAFILSNLCFPYMKDNGGTIIHVSSVEGLKPSEGLGIYSVSKAALIMLAKSQAKEWGKHTIRVNVICPGLVKTKFSASLWQNQQMLEEWNKKIPLHRMAHPDEMSGLAVFLASEASSYCTGMVFTADGGYMIS